ncbi:glutaminase A [Leekyejoonella antrihumi]|uniref:Glutaminase n=1 Tax=Leekyejoonella antrihumi TaxID=1660198 RepID=A0A563DVV0_9MICO|nr:glutaminase A [Leekyejoonella antrihumi]TWP34111.1 glutaminase A [Leekyejoonella antrihumi]
MDLVTSELAQIHQGAAQIRDGEVSTYLPQLAAADPELFGLAVVSMAGNVYRAGDAAAPFTIQSVSKPFVFALTLAELGLDTVLRNVGAEPSGEAFNAISLEVGTGRPDNPMVNAGAIVTSSLVPGDREEKWGRIRHTLSAFAGRTLEMDEDVCATERAGGDRNRALAYLMRSAGSLVSDADDAVEVYFRQCSLVVDCVDLAVMAATLGNGGVNPCTGVQVVPGLVAEHVLTVMATCGMYDYAGEWMLRVGFPAKSGISGCLTASSPAQLGLGAYSPRLDHRGNAVRPVAAARELSQRFDLHLMHDLGLSAPTVFYETDEPDATGGGTTSLRRLQGEIEFAAAETVLAALEDVGRAGTRLVLDLSHVTRLQRLAAAMIDARLAALREEGVSVVVTDRSGRHLLSAVDRSSQDLRAELAARS